MEQNIKDEISQLTEQYQKLKELQLNEEERAVLKKKIWNLKHRKFLKFGETCSKLFNWSGKKLKKGSEKIMEYGNNYEKNISKENSKLNKDIIP